MKGLLSGLLVGLVFGGAFCRSNGQPDPQPDESGTPSFEVEHGWPKLPGGYILEHVSGVVVDSLGNIVTFSGPEWQSPFSTELLRVPTIQIWDSVNGTLMNSWGADTFRMPHGLGIDADDNLWVTDIAHNQVFKFTHDGELSLVIGEAGVEGADEEHFAQPTDVACGLDGSVYVSDGYVNSRVVNFSAQGKYRFEWGQRGDAPGEFNLPHALTVDTRGRVYVADRENDRIQVFEPDGTFIEEWRSEGSWRPYGLSISQGEGRVFIADGGEQPETLPHRSGIVMLDLTGNPVERFARYGNQDGQFLMAHDVAVDRSGMVYVADVIGRRIQKFYPSR